MQELREKVMEKIRLEEEFLALEQEQKKLKKEVFDLRIAADNEQYDVDRLEGFSLKGIALSLSGQKEERLEEERRQARNAKAKFDFTSGRIQNVELRLEQIPMELEVLGDCHKELLRRILEGPGEKPWLDLAEQAHDLEDLLKEVKQLQKDAWDLRAAAEALESWTLGVGYSRGGEMASYEAATMSQKKLNDFVARVCPLEEKLQALGLGRGLDAWAEYDNRYLKDADFGRLERCATIMGSANNAYHVMKALIPKIDKITRQKWIELCQALVQTSL